MVIAGVFSKVLTDENRHFTDAITGNNIENESIDFPANWKAIGLQKLLIHTVWIWSDQGLDWKLRLCSNSSYTNFLEDEIELPASDAFEMLHNGQYYYTYEPVKPIPYEDKSGMSKIHLGLINDSFVSKTAGSAGKVKIGLKIESVVF